MAAARGADWLEAAVEALPVPVVVIEPGGTIVVANARAHDLLALRPGDAAPASLRRLADAVHDHDVLSETLEVPVGVGATVLAEVRVAAIAGGAVLTIDDLSERGRRDFASSACAINSSSLVDNCERCWPTISAYSLAKFHSGTRSRASPACRPSLGCTSISRTRMAWRFSL